MVTSKNILYRLYVVVILLFVFAIAIMVQLYNVQYVDGDKYREIAEKQVVREDVVKANRGSIYADDGSLLATSVPKYNIRFDAKTVSDKNFNENIEALSDSLAVMLGKNRQYYKTRFKQARRTGNRYLFVARNLGYSDYMKLKTFPIFNLGSYKGGLIVEQHVKRERPIGGIASRTIGKTNSSSGIEGAFDSLYLRRKDGKRLKRKIGKGQYKPIFDENEIESQDGLDVISTINVNIQDIAHEALLNQLKKFKADHGTVVVMETKTGEIKAMSNQIGRASCRERVYAPV